MTLQRRVLAVLLLAAGSAGAASLEQRLDELVRLGDERPSAALAALDALAPADTAAERRLQALARAAVASGGPGAADARREREAAVAAARAIDSGLAQADEHYLLALRAEHDDAAPMADHARRGLAAYEAWCKSAAAAPAPASAPASAPSLAPPPAECEYRPRWRLHQLLSQLARIQHAPQSARQHARAAADLVVAGDDAWRQAWSEAELALAAGHERDFTRAQEHLERAQHLAGAGGQPQLLARIALAEGNVAQDRGDSRQAHDAWVRALAAARQTPSARIEAIVLVNLSDQAVQSGRAAEALDAALQGLAVVRPLQIKRLERALLSNAMLARVALGRGAEAHADFDALQASWSADGATGHRVTSMREFGDALARAGDLKGALELHHREAELARQLMADNRDAALAELRTRYDSEAQQRGILLLERDNALKSAELANQALSHRLWALGAGVLALAMVLMLLLVRRVRETNRALEHSRAKLRVQSERDALTGLANRRRFQGVLQAQAEAGAFRGALLMIDIDHFKHINDNHGHASGDQVLIEVARRIAAAVRSDDTVARWGGEEFLALAPGLRREDTDALAQRLLQTVAGEPVTLPDGRSLRVTASIGHAVFPLPPHRVRLSPEQAVNLADMALYTAKSQGRNRAVGIVQADADDDEGLRQLEADFERAWVDGRVQLRIDAGPEPVGRWQPGGVPA